MKNHWFKVVFILLYVLPVVGYAQYNLRATATAASCFGGSITITADNISGDITYYIYNDDDYLESSSNVISNVNPGDYFYGFYKSDFTEYDESSEVITVGSSPCTGVGITAVSEVASCPGTGKITVSITNLPGTITYAIAKSPYLEANVITSSNPIFTNLDVGNYFYGYYDGTSFIKSPTTISIAPSYSTTSPTISNVVAKNYTYCPGDSPSFGEITGIVGGGNSIYTVTLTKVSDNSVVSSVVGCNGCNFSFKNVLPGDYNLEAVDRCGTVVFYPVAVNLPANVPVPANSIIEFDKRFPQATIVYNDPANPCSGMSKASIKLSDLVYSNAYSDGHAYFKSITPSFVPGFTPTFVYKLEIQNGSSWEVYDNLSWSNPDLSTNFDLPTDRSKWGLVRLTASACGVSKTLTLYYGSSSLGKDFPFDTTSLYFLNDPAYRDCASTGKVRLDVRPGGGCGPYTLEVTEKDTNTKTIYSSSSTFDTLLSVGKTYNFKITDSDGVEPPLYVYGNNTTSAIKQPILNNAKNILIDPVYFTPATKDRRGSVIFYKGASGKYFGKSALMAKVIFRDPAFATSSGLEGNATITLESGPSTLDITKDQYGNFGLGNNLSPGTYKIRVQDSDCFNELYDVVLDSYFTNIEFTVSSAPSSTDCDRYVKSAKVNVSYVGNAKADDALIAFYTTDYLFYVRTVTGPVISSANDEAYTQFDYQKNRVRGGISNMVYTPEVAGNYVIGLYTPFEGVAKPITTAPLEVKSNFPVFDLKASGGIVCTGNTTGDLSVKVDNVDGTETYFIKKDTDAVFPATAQQSSIFTGLAAGNYVVKVKIGCYEVEQPLTLRPPLNNLVLGTPSFCEGGSLSLTLDPTVPLSSVHWTTPNGKVYNSRDLKLDNLTATDVGTYKVEANTSRGCSFFEVVTVTMNQAQEPTGPANQEFCKVNNNTVADLVTTESGVTWYDAATAGNIMAPTTVLENNKVYYGSLKAGTCDSPTRLAVTVTLSDPQTPTTSKTTQEFCKTDNKTVTDLAVNESDVTWYDAATGGNAVASTTTLENNKVYYGSLKAGTCESPTRLAVTVTLSDPQTPTTSKTTQEFCKTDNKTVADLAVNESGVTWYDAATGGNAVASTTLLENNKVYYGSLKEGTCESPTRLAITVTLSDPQTPTTSKTTQEFCKTDNKTVADLAVNESDVTWYDAATAGNVVASTTTLENNKVYYGSLKAGTCESPTRLAVTVTLSDPQTPTTSKTIQEFCKTDNKTVADLAVNESGVTWYDAATGGNAVASTTTLENNKVYYGSLKVGTCESPTRLAVTVTLSDPKTPTTTKSAQEFCKTDNKTVADLAVNESDVTWYDAANNGNAVASTAVLENNKVYYGSLKAGTCESPTRLAVTVTLSDPQTPTTSKTIQEFCKTDNKTVADLAVNESGVTWYDTATAGNVVASTTLLENNKVYYGSLKEGTCESPTRLAVTVTLSDPQTPTTSKITQEFCKTDNKTVADLAVNESDVTWYDAATAGSAIASTVILENNKVYYGSLKAGTCESPTRLAVTVTLSDPQTPTTSKTIQEFCKTDNKTVADLAVNESEVTWYDAVTGGNAVASTTTLENNKVYYGSLKAGTCESPTRLAVTVTLSDPQTPTTSKTTQEFCKVDSKKVSDLVTIESNVTWYDAATGGNVIVATILLENNKVYYGSLKVGTCESPTRLAVTVTLSDPQTPTTSKTIQEFCKTDNKTVADLAVNESDVTWYDAATAGNAVASTTTLENNKVYYGSLKAGTCESPTRLAVTVTLSDPQTPTTSKITQEFCKTDNKTVADLAVNESGVTWYDTATGGNAVASTTTLENNKVYYGSLKAGTCESPIRLAVKALVKGCTVESPQNWSTTSCVFDEATYKVANGMSDYNWIVSKEGVIVAGGESTDDYVTVIWNSAGKATVKVEYIDVSKFDPLVLIDFPVAVNSCSDVGLKKTVDNPTPGIGHEVVFTITAENLGTNVVKEVMISEKLPSGYDYVTSQTSSGSYNSVDGIWTLPVLQAHENQTLKITAKVKEFGDYLNIAYLKNSNPLDINEMNNRAEASVAIEDVIVYNAISINGDGLNDYFKIAGLHNYPNNTVEIFNRNGVEIFKTHNYGSDNNVFRGISEGRATISKKSGVPTGTYFYILRYEIAGVFREKVGYLYVSNN